VPLRHRDPGRERQEHQDGKHPPDPTGDLHAEPQLGHLVLAHHRDVREADGIGDAARHAPVDLRHEISHDRQECVEVERQLGIAPFELVVGSGDRRAEEALELRRAQCLLHRRFEHEAGEAERRNACDELVDESRCEGVLHRGFLHDVGREVSERVGRKEHAPGPHADDREGNERDADEQQEAGDERAHQSACAPR
jgi:hypothetical protein